MENYAVGEVDRELKELVSGAFAARANEAGPAPPVAGMKPGARPAWRWLLPVPAGLFAIYVGATFAPSGQSGSAQMDAEFAAVTRWQGPTDEYLGLPFQEYRNTLPRFEVGAIPGLEQGGLLD